MQRTCRQVTRRGSLFVTLVARPTVDPRERARTQAVFPFILLSCLFLSPAESVRLADVYAQFRAPPPPAQGWLLLIRKTQVIRTRGLSPLTRSHKPGR